MSTDVGRDNVVLIHWRDLGRDLKCYGARGAPSSTVDMLAASGIRFANAHASDSVSSPALGSFFGGGYRHPAGRSDQCSESCNDSLALPEVLSRDGYRTALFGMPHSRADPNRLGFDEVDVVDSRCGYVAARSREWLCNRTAPGDDRPFFLTAGFVGTHRPQGCAHRAGSSGSVVATDAALGHLLAEVADPGLVDRTWTIVLTDPAPAPHAVDTAVALIMRPPARRSIPAGVYDEQFSGTDLTPTLLDLLGVEVPAGVDGESHAGALLNR